MIYKIYLIKVGDGEKVRQRKKTYDETIATHPLIAQSSCHMYACQKGKARYYQENHLKQVATAKYGIEGLKRKMEVGMNVCM